MPLPLLFIGIAAVTGVSGVSKTIGAAMDQSNAKKLNQNSDERIENAALRLEELRRQCGEALDNLGKEKIFVLDNNVKRFLDTFKKIKNVDFQNSEGLEELSKFHVDSTDFEELEEISSFASSMAKGSLMGIGGGALSAFGAYSAAGTLAYASTGAAISTLSGAAASNATLAFFGGGSIASGGLGVAGGTAILGGLVAGPALLIMGTIVGAKAGKNLEDAQANAAMATEYCEELENGAFQCIAIRRRTNMFYTALANTDAHFLPLICDMETVFNNEGDDYSLYCAESKKKIAMAASMAVTVKSILDTPILTADGSLTAESDELESHFLEK